MMRSATAAFLAFGLLLPAAALAETGGGPDGSCDVDATPIPELECLTIEGDYSAGLYYGEICARTLTLTNTCDQAVTIVETECEPEACVSATLEPGDEFAIHMEIPEPYEFGDESSVLRFFEASTDTVEATLEIKIRNFYEAPEYPDEPPVDEPDTDAGYDEPDDDAGDNPGTGGCSTSGNTPAPALLTLAGALGLVALRRRR
ncbi:hypothetical protein FRC96_03215 [Lujinxingia vulgaris]|uniref:Gram-positive cocci surface proteins LPxTG domain-containing protein n=1 Tax=Lujinxingia vulgaris TaxID=2600176 RepID=A0A5C6XQ38_9DELT|nr:MYXO-CTERM sorting domain-containing protein [Lujinxingia vulgaris]TXD42690.1 hypothetical protein FRC96_03215 [Lujinxingia vulgaris]